VGRRVLIELFVSSLITFFVVIDPPGCAPIFAGLTAGQSPIARRSTAVRATLVAGGILLTFALAGQALLHALGISLNSFRIAGGLLLFLIALEMVFERRTQRREDRAAEVMEETPADDVAIFPMAMPMIAGPGSIASVMLLMGRNQWEDGSRVMVLAAMLAVMALMLGALLAAGPLMRVLGAKIEAVITRLLGVLLAALAVQFVVDGLKISLG
jgi:multiple antibiotic resistance protein